MSVQYSDIKTRFQTLFPQYVGKGFIESDSGSPTELALLADLANNDIASFPYEWEFLRQTGTITLTGATSYNLATLLPDLQSVYQIYGINQNQEHPVMSNYEANIASGDGWSLRDKTLYFTGNLPTTGTITLQYKSKWMVKDSSGTRKQFFTNDSDVSALDDSDLPALLWGAGKYIELKGDNDKRLAFCEKKFIEAFNNMLFRNGASNQLDTVL